MTITKEYFMNRNLTKRTGNPLQSWFNDMNSLFDKYGRDLSLFDENDLEFSPKIEVKETDKGYFVRAEVPGMEEKDLDISLSDNSLILKGERKSEKKEEDKSHYFSEFKYGSFYRSIPLEEEVDSNNVSATYKDGILNVEIKKNPSASPKQKKISIKH